jgi:hypothetical protein
MSTYTTVNGLKKIILTTVTTEILCIYMLSIKRKELEGAWPVH